MLGLAVAAFVALFALQLPFPLIILAAGSFGYFGTKQRPDIFKSAGHAARGMQVGPSLGLDRETGHFGTMRIASSLGVWLALWVAPVLLLALVLGPSTIFLPIAAFFSKMAVVTFGGAYAVLAYVAQEAVSGLHWLNPGEMLDGLALAETTPGPLILVLTHVGYLAAYRSPGALHPLAAGLIGAALTTWVTFVPCFLWIFLGAPFVERLRSNAALSGALAAITAAVVGVIANLALWFGLNFLFSKIGILSFGPVSLQMPVLCQPGPAGLVAVDCRRPCPAPPEGRRPGPARLFGRDRAPHLPRIDALGLIDQSSEHEIRASNRVNRMSPTRVSLAVILAASLGLAGCNGAGNSRQQAVAAPEQATPRLVTPSGFKLPDGAGCSGAVARFRALIDSDLDVGHTTKTVHAVMSGDIDRAAAACAAGNDAGARAQIAASRSRHGYPSS